MTSDTAMCAWKTPCTTVKPAAASKPAEMFVEWLGLFGSGSVGEAGAPALAHVGVEGELAHRQHGAPYVAQGEVHLARGFLEDAQPRDLVGQQRRLCSRRRYG